MTIPFLIAHGALGGADELIFLGIAVIFIGMMGVTWVRSQSIDMDDEEPEPTPTKGAKKKQPKASSSDHFKLD